MNLQKTLDEYHMSTVCHVCGIEDVMVCGFLQIETLVETQNKVVACVARRSLSRGRLREEEVVFEGSKLWVSLPGHPPVPPRVPFPAGTGAVARFNLAQRRTWNGTPVTANLELQDGAEGKGAIGVDREDSREGRWRRDRAHHTSLPPLFAISPLHHPPFSCCSFPLPSTCSP